MVLQAEPGYIEQMGLPRTPENLRIEAGYWRDRANEYERTAALSRDPTIPKMRVNICLKRAADCETEANQLESKA